MGSLKQIQEQKIEIENAVATALELAAKYATTAEVAITKSTGLSVSAHNGEVENVEFNSDGALGITVYSGKRKGSASTSDLSENAILQTVLAAVDIAKYTSEDPYASLLDPKYLAKDVLDLDLFHPDTLDPDKAALIAISAEDAALNYHPLVTKSDGASYDSHYGMKVYGNTNGFLKSYVASRHSISCSVIGTGKNNEMERDYSYSVARHVDDLWSAKLVGEKAAQKASSRLDPHKLTTGKYPVLFMADVATGLIGHLTAAISGGSLYRKSSFLLDKLGTQILPKWFNISERPHILRGLASTPFDSEGMYTQDCEIITDGILATYLLSGYAARKMKMEPTGHAGGIHNWFIKSTGQDFTQLLKELDTGLIVTELMGQGVNGVTGDYSRGASGFWVDKGAIKYPVSEITIAGNLTDMFVQIVAVGSDIETRSQIQTGSILIESMKVAGQ